MSINLARMREILAAEIAERVTVEDLTVYPRGVDGTLSSPAVVFGLVDVEYDVQPCDVHTYSIGVAVVVNRSGISEVVTFERLEETWLDVERAVRGLLADDALDELGPVNTSMTRAESGSFMVQGQSWPAQEITLEITG